jgi:pyruvate/2-oxoglutarate dehydrogenase complex dihydrolipoamide acyltransferase (E2) component
MESPEKKSNFVLGDLPRPRLNVLDLIDVIGHRTIPTYLFCEIDMGWAEEVRKKMKALGLKVTVTAFLLKAIAIAQRSHPESRTAALPWGKTVTFSDIVAGFTVERYIGNQPAVFFGAIEHPDTKSLIEISSELQQYAEAKMNDVRQLSLQSRFNKFPGWLRQSILWAGKRYPKVRLLFQGATFGLSSIGKWGMSGLIPPCVATSTFGVGQIEDKAVVRDGQIVIRPMMTIILNFDHRIIDGGPAARFMTDVKRLLEGGLEHYMSLDMAASTPPTTLSLH